MTQRITCKDYNIHINDWEGIRTFIKKKPYSQIFILVDENTDQACLPIFQSELKTDFIKLEVKSGESNKDLHTCEHIWEELTHHGADRHSLLINLGGGVIGDMGGFAAATYMRGMHFIQVPTTLLSQVDASVGGKLGVDFQGFKNMIGLIKNPSAVFIFTEFLNSLPYRQLLSGFAELLKHGLIAEKDVFTKLSSIWSLEAVDWAPIVRESVEIKKTITEQDPKERGLRKVLNFGHTAGHAIESVGLETDSPLLHGEAIAIGMIIESHLSYSKGFISLSECDHIKEVLIGLYGHQHDKIPSTDRLKQLMLKDKKNKSGKIKFSLLEAVGKGNFDKEVTDQDFNSAVSYYLS